MVKQNITILWRAIANATGINYLQMGIMFTELFKQVSCSCSTIYMNSVISLSQKWTTLRNLNCPRMKYKQQSKSIEATIFIQCAWLLHKLELLMFLLHYFIVKSSTFSVSEYLSADQVLLTGQSSITCQGMFSNFLLIS